MNCQKLFSGQNKKDITKLLSAESAQRVVNVKISLMTEVQLHVICFLK